MKTTTVTLISFLVLFGFNTRAQNNSYNSIASKMVNVSLKVQPGETVVISGTPDEIQLMEELFVEASKAGGKARIELNIPSAIKRALMSTENEYLEMLDAYNVMQMKSVDCYINVGSEATPGLFSDVPEEKLVAARKSGLAIAGLYQSVKFRSVALGQIGGIPSQAFAKRVGADYESMIEMFWKAVDVDYDQLLKTGERLIKHYQPGSMCKLTSDSGTNLSFKIGKSAPGISSGIATRSANSNGPASTWLPAGEAYVALDPYSAEGTLVVPHYRYRNKDIKNLKIIFNDGKISSLSADSNIDDLRKSFELSSGMKDVLSSIDVGINHESKPLNDDEYLSYEMAGVVTLGIGVNTWTGGNVNSDFGISFFLANSTLNINGNNLIVDGKLQ
jgi:leucyl aminopeptidase (aminopeptidase T)